MVALGFASSRADRLIASRTEVTILRDMGQESAVAAPELDEAMDLAARLAAAAEEGRVVGCSSLAKDPGSIPASWSPGVRADFRTPSSRKEPASAYCDVTSDPPSSPNTLT